MKIGPIERISIELTNRCSKGCRFCYNKSNSAGDTTWTAEELAMFVTDCAHHGTESVSFGGGEPLEFDGVFDLLSRLDGVLLRSMTTNGLLLRDGVVDRLVAVRPDKVHVSIHFPENQREVERVIHQVGLLSDRGIPAGVNLLVARSQLRAAAQAAALLHAAGIDDDGIVYLPMRGGDTPTPEQVAQVTGSRAFQSMSCLTACGPSERFCSVRWDKAVAWCSYTDIRRQLRTIDYAGLVEALDGLGLAFCGNDDKGRGQGNKFDLLARQAVDGPSTDSRRVIATGGLAAAHSMDTEWFATDADDNVALLDSDEEGGVPKAFLQGRDYQFDFSEMVDLLLDEDLNHGVEFYTDDIIRLGPGRILHPIGFGEPWDVPLKERIITLDSLREKRQWRPQTWLGAILEKLGFDEPTYLFGSSDIFWLRDADTLKRLVFKHARCRRLPTSDQVFVLLNSLGLDHSSTNRLVEMLQEGAILSMLSDGMALRPERFGFYRYGDPEYARYDYQRLGIPIGPVSVNQLPPKAQAVCNRVKFNTLTFANTACLRPADDFECEWARG